VQQGATLVIAGADPDAATPLLGAGTVTRGTGTNPGQAFATGIYLQGNLESGVVPLTFSPTGTATVAGVIGDDTGSAAAANYVDVFGGYTEGSVGIVVNGTGTLKLQAVNTYTGSSTITKGRLELAAGASAATGTIAFGGPAATLQIDGNAMPSNTIDAMVLGDIIDLRGLPFVAGATANYDASAQVLTVTSNGISKTLTLTNPAGTGFRTPTNDGSSGTQVSLVDPTTFSVMGLTNGSRPTAALGRRCSVRLPGVPRATLRRRWTKAAARRFGRALRTLTYQARSPQPISSATQLWTIPACRSRCTATAAK
jgi:autotransporter-associated beta strand protein